MALTAASSGDAFDALLWAGVLIVVVVAGGFVLMWLRARLFKADEPDRGGDSGMLDDLRRAHRAGTLTDDQFQRARDRVLRSARGEEPGVRPVHHEVTADGAVRAKPGYDLTGVPLPASGIAQADGRSGPDNPRSTT